jgi:hypothetical protein
MSLDGLAEAAEAPLACPVPELVGIQHATEGELAGIRQCRMLERAFGEFRPADE